MSFYEFKYGFIYKITNILNGDSYIGQVYNKSIEERWDRHIDPIIKNKEVKSHLGRALKKYGIENFKIEKIDTAYSVEDINKKEKYWIKYYKDKGIKLYNETDGGEGGNTYKYKTKEEMDEIKKKISKANSGKNNGLSKQIKAMNIVTGEIFHFETINRTLKFLGIKSKGIVTDLCEHKRKYYWRDVWNFSYEDEDFKQLEFYKGRPKKYNIKKVKLINKNTKETMIFKNKYSMTCYINKNKINLNNYEWRFYEEENNSIG